jgi:phage gp29-like protein
MWEIDGGKVWCSDIRWRHPKKFTFYSKDAVLDAPRLLTEAERFYGEELPPNKFIYHRAGGRMGSVPRMGVLRACAWMYLFKNYTLKDWVVFLERFAMPLRVGKYSPGSSEEERKVLRNAVFNLGADAAAVISESTVIELLEQGGKTATAAIYEKLAERCDKAISKAVLGHTGSSDSTPGKLGSEHEARDVRRDLLEADARALAKTVAMQLIYPLVLFNFGADKPLPVFRFAVEEGEDLKELAETFKGLNEMGVEIPVSHIRLRFGIPEPKKGEATTTRSTGFGPQAMKDACTGCGATRRVAMKSGDDRDLVDHFTGRLLDEAPVDGLVEQVEALLNEVSSLDEFRDRLLDIYKDIDVTALGTVMQKALAAAELSGRFKATNAGR